MSYPKFKDSISSYLSTTAILLTHPSHLIISKPQTKTRKVHYRTWLEAVPRGDRFLGIPKECTYQWNHALTGNLSLSIDRYQIYIYIIIKYIYYNIGLYWTDKYCPGFNVDIYPACLIIEFSIQFNDLAVNWTTASRFTIWTCHPPTPRPPTLPPRNCAACSGWQTLALALR